MTPNQALFMNINYVGVGVGGVQTRAICFLPYWGQHSCPLFGSGQHFLCYGGKGQQTEGPPRVTEDLATPLV